MNSSREARRRRITERGTDRLALITGQIPTFPSDSGSDDSRVRSHTASCPPSISQLQLPSSRSPSLDSPHAEDNGSGILPSKLDSISETSGQSMSGDRVGPIMRKCDSNMESARVSGFDLDGKGPLFQVPSTDRSPLVSRSVKDQCFEPVSRLLEIFASNDVISAISATESTRALCSLLMALLVVLAYVGFPILGSRFVKSVIFFRPLYLLLLTNITIVVARLLGRQRVLPRPERQATGNPSVGENGLADQLGNALGLGLLLQNVTGTLLMDCSIYAITVICGISLAQRVGW